MKILLFTGRKKLISLLFCDDSVVFLLFFALIWYDVTAKAKEVITIKKTETDKKYKTKKIAVIITAVILALITASGLFPVLTRKRPAGNAAEPGTAANTVTVTFPEGLTVTEIANKLEENNVCSADDFMAAINDSTNILCLSYGFIPFIDNISDRAFLLEGYIFPDTYEFYIGESASTALGRFLKNTDKKLTGEHYARADELGYTIDEIIALASVIQKEAGEKEEMKRVSSVLHNRLNDAGYGRLECDVTINYLENFVLSSPYLSGDTERFKELYNTYKCFGLPVGAICNPGLDAIEAALYPEDTPYHFFVTDSEMNYYYAETYAEHKENCKQCGLVG